MPKAKNKQKKARELKVVEEQPQPQMMNNGEFQADLKDIIPQYDQRLAKLEGEIVFARAAVATGLREINRLTEILEKQNIDPQSGDSSESAEPVEVEAHSHD